MKPYFFTKEESDYLHRRSAELHAAAARFVAPVEPKTQATQVPTSAHELFVRLCRRTSLSFLWDTKLRDMDRLAWRTWIIGELYLTHKLDIPTIAKVTGYSTGAIWNRLNSVKPKNPMPIFRRNETHS